ncbi:MAG: NYN domain-containing protein [Acidobacteriota bacterium]|nr:MAG: NYN domain-containing protein [Acidobacteriota bacterium]
MYLIDGNNVIGQRVGWHRDKEGARRRLILELAEFVRLRRARASVVFDGAADPKFPEGSSYRSVRIFYARQSGTADDRIIEMVEAERNRKNLTVVTSDGQLASRVRVCGVRIMRSGEFRGLIDALGEAGGGQAEPGVTGEEIPEWLRYFGVAEEDDESEAD